MSKQLVAIAIIAGWSGGTFAQDPQFSQFYAAPQYLNPALTGNTQQERIAMNYRLQWAGQQPGYETYMAAYDHRFSKANTGIGAMVLRDKAGTTGLNQTTLAMSYSYEARLNYKRAVRVGLGLGYTTRGTNPGGFVFADQMIRDNAPVSVEANWIQRISYLDVSAGGLYFSERLWAGVACNHLNRPNQSLQMEGEARLPVRTSIHAGYRFPLGGGTLSRSGTNITLATLYKTQGTWDQFDVGGYVDHGPVCAGLWYRGLPVGRSAGPDYRGNDAVILMAGYSSGALRVVYSYDITISKLTMRSGGAHKISLVHEWPRRPQKHKPRVIPCPKF